MKELTVVGIGPGSRDGLTLGAVKALEKAEVIVGYTAYCQMIQEIFPGKEIVSTPMRQEIARCRMALKLAAEGRAAVMVCSGDAGIYGMAAPLLELAEEYGVEIRVIPGVTAAISGAAGLGSPLTSDFCVLSLSDQLIPWELIEKRLDLAAQADLVLVLYNPGSHTRTEHLRRACEIVSRTHPADTVCGIATDIGREEESFRILTLSALAGYTAGMRDTVFIGNSTTRQINGKMVTPRGYRL